MTRKRRRRRRAALTVRARPPRPGLLFTVPIALICTATVLGLSKSGTPIYQPARLLWLPGGAGLILYGVLVRNGVVRAHREDATTRVVALLTGAFGLACIGGGLEEAFAMPAWRVLTLPLIVVGGLWSLRMAWLGKRHPFVREMGAGRSRAAVRSGLWMFGLAWPLFALWAVGLVRLDG